MTDALDRRIDDALRAQFAPPQLADLAARLRAAAEKPRPQPRRWPWLLLPLAAAVLAWLAFGHHLFAPTGAKLASMWAVAYDDAVENGFERGSCCCGADGDLRRFCEQRFGASVTLASGAPVETCGSCCGLPTGPCCGLLVRADGEPVLVFVHPRDQDPRPDANALREHTLHRREVGPLVFYELSRSPEERVLAHLRVAE